MRKRGEGRAGTTSGDANETQDQYDHNESRNGTPSALNTTDSARAWARKEEKHDYPAKAKCAPRQTEIKTAGSRRLKTPRARTLEV